MTDYTYTNLDRMRDAIANSDWMDIGRVDPETIAAGYRYFDNWLAEHDREVAEKAYDEGVEIGRYYAEDMTFAPLSPYRWRSNKND